MKDFGPSLVVLFRARRTIAHLQRRPSAVATSTAMVPFRAVGCRQYVITRPKVRPRVPSMDVILERVFGMFSALQDERNCLHDRPTAPQPNSLNASHSSHGHTIRSPARIRHL